GDRLSFGRRVASRDRTFPSGLDQSELPFRSGLKPLSIAVDLSGLAIHPVDAGRRESDARSEERAK
ncbi:hypothetical protein, partial [uncultured Ilumatobacter sp.]|uniref:hypothetical protein n=1 Tax=uncultured Ilumatobacter sp. TaxID=879968 RepID=UPI00374F3FCF